MTAILTVLGVLLGLSALGLAWSTVMVWRVRWVYRNGVELLHRDLAAYLRLPEFNVMVNRWWIWDFEEFYREGS